MATAYVAVATVTAIALAYAGYMNFTRNEVVIEAARTVRAPQSWIYPLGTILSAAALGLLLGFVVPAVGAAAAIGVVLYFSAAMFAHVRVGDYHLLPPAIFLALAVATLALDVADGGLA